MMDARMTAANKEVFLDLLAEYGVVSKACQLAQVGRRTVYEWKKEDPAFAEQWDEAMEQAADGLETEARRRAVDGVLEPVYYKGFLVDEVRKYSDTLLIFLLKGVRPDKFKERWQGDVSVSKPVQVNWTIRLEGEDDGQAAETP